MGVTGEAIQAWARASRTWRNASTTEAGIEAGDIAAQAGDFAHQRGRNEAVLLGRGQEQRLDLGDQVAVHARHLEFVFEIRHRAQAAQQHAGTDVADKMRQQRVEAAHFDVVVPAERFACQFHAAFERKRRALGRAVGDAHHDLVEQWRGAGNEVDSGRW